MLQWDITCTGIQSIFRWVHDYQDACVDKVEKFLRGEKMPHMDKVPSQSSLQSDSRGSPGRNTPRNSLDGSLTML